ncbi:unnamed protein product [Echinostoma caproni]|uniref:Kunitz/Bovine pancreatic trypsin inhibitor domain protein n=1 Tax=Echinostoma caproni TaxID=27848 RepID=A0A183A7E1_9TREM|nr:unnamed protein product [Echinostoma caproni]
MQRNTWAFYEGKHIVKPVHFRRQPTVLYATAGFGAPQNDNNAPPPPSITRFQVFPPSKQHGNRAIKSPQPIPPQFVRSARLHAFNSLFTDRILTKPKRWAISTLYNPLSHSFPMESDLSKSNPTSSSIPTTTTTSTTTTTTSETPTSTATTTTIPSVAETATTIVVPSSYRKVGLQHRGITDRNTSVLNPMGPVVRSPRAGEDRMSYMVQLTTDEPMYPVYPEAPAPDFRIKQNYLPAKSDPDPLADFEMEGYRPVREPEVFEPMRPVQHSAAPWAYRDVYRFGPPRHPACSQPLNRGVGPDEVSSWYFDTQLNVCRWFGYRGYGGNSNRFYSRTACESLCIRDVENLCETVKCSWHGTHCSLVGDQACKHAEEMYGRDWSLRCPPDQPVCLSRRGTRIAPDIDFKNIPHECFQPKDPGSCERKNPAVMFHYDRERNDCMTFYYHNCGGNDNRFETKSDCMSHCSP